MKTNRCFAILLCVLLACAFGCAAPVPAPAEATAAPTAAPSATPTAEPTAPPEELYAQAKTLYDAKDYEAAAAILTELEPLEHAGALALLGSCFWNGEGVEQDKDRAYSLFSLALEKDGNEPRAQHGMGLCYDNGIGVDADPVEAHRWYLMAAEQGYAPAQYYAGWNYREGVGVEAQDYAKAMEWWIKAAEQGDSYAQNGLGAMYHLGQVVEQDYGKAAEWFEKAAEQNHSAALRTLAIYYTTGRLGEPDAEKAFDYTMRMAGTEEMKSEARRAAGTEETTSTVSYIVTAIENFVALKELDPELFEQKMREYQAAGNEIANLYYECGSDVMAAIEAYMVAIMEE